MSAASHQQRIHYLDGIRGLLALCVVTNHIFGALTEWDLHRPFCGAYLAVDFFFILSGYVLSFNLATKPEEHNGLFLLKRFARLWPLHVFCIGLMLIVSCNNSLNHQFVPEWFHHPSLSIILCNIFFLHNLGINHSSIINDPSWSISIEFWVSSIPLFIIFRLRKAWIAALIPITIWSMLFYLHKQNLFGSNDLDSHIAWPHSLNMGLARGLAGILWGNILFRIKNHNLIQSLSKISTQTIAWIAFCISGYIIYYQYGKAWIDLIELAVISLLVLSLDDYSGLGRLLSLKPLIFLGDISFALYLCHTALIINFTPKSYEHAFGQDGAVLYILLLCILTAYGIHKAIEIPSRKFFYRLIASRT